MRMQCLRPGCYREIASGEWFACDQHWAELPLPIRGIIMKLNIYAEKLAFDFWKDASESEEVAVAVEKDLEQENVGGTEVITNSQGAVVDVIHKRDWRIGAYVKPKHLKNHLIREDPASQRGTVIDVHPDGFEGLNDKDGILRIKMRDGREILVRADDWITA